VSWVSPSPIAKDVIIQVFNDQTQQEGNDKEPFQNNLVKMQLLV
jgi:hypothetical protein